MLAISSRTWFSAVTAASWMKARCSAGSAFHQSVFTTTMNSMSALLVTVMVSITSHSLRDLTPDTPVMPTSTVPR